MEIAGKKAVVAGGASGMARAAATMLVERGATVAILDLPSVERAMEDATEALAGLHIAVNTAGGGIAKRTLSKDGPHRLDDFRAVVELNLIGTFNLNRLQAWQMSLNEPEDDERGVIINTSSIAAFEGQIGQVAYTASKAGIAGMALTMARDLGGLGIRVVAIAPSLFSTGITAKIPQEMSEALLRDVAFPKRMGRPEEYGKLAVAIVENPMLNGSTIRLDAGQRFGPR
jgi:NAD(P)-dependent dehydrogenase (short-subunit alcohol dehydrogenase family)